MDRNSDIEAYYHQGDVTGSQMRGLAYFAEKFADPEFELGRFHAMPVVKGGPKKPIFILSDVANDFVTFCINEKLVDLRIDTDGMNWGKVAIGEEALASSSPYDLVVLLTLILGNPTHWQSRFINSFQSGLLQSILDRGTELAGGE